MWETVMKKRFGFLRCIIILSAVVLTLNIAIMLGKYLVYLFIINKHNIMLLHLTLKLYLNSK